MEWLTHVLPVVVAVVGTGWIVGRTLDEKVNAVRAAVAAGERTTDEQVAAIRAVFAASEQARDEQVAAIRAVTGEQVAAIRAAIEQGTREHEDFRQGIRDANRRLDQLMAALIDRPAP